MAVDDSEDVIEIMGDAAGELTDGFHLLGLAELVFEAFLAGDVAEKSEEKRGVAAEINEGVGIFEHDDVAVVESQAAFDLFFDDPVTETLPIFLEELFRGLGIGIDDGQGFAFKRVPSHADEFAESFVDSDDDSVFIGQAHAVDGVFPN